MKKIYVLGGRVYQSEESFIKEIARNFSTSQLLIYELVEETTLSDYQETQIAMSDRENSLNALLNGTKWQSDISKFKGLIDFEKIKKETPWSTEFTIWIRTAELKLTKISNEEQFKKFFQSSAHILFWNILPSVELYKLILSYYVPTTQKLEKIYKDKTNPRKVRGGETEARKLRYAQVLENLEIAKQELGLNNQKKTKK